MAEVLGDETGVSEFLAQPGRGGVAEGVRGDVFLESCPFRCTAEDLGEDRLLEPSAVESAEDRRLGAWGARGSEGAKLTHESGRERLPAGLAAFAPADEERRRGGVEVEVAPVEREQLRAPQSGGCQSAFWRGFAVVDARPRARPSCGDDRERGRDIGPRPTTFATMYI